MPINESQGSGEVKADCGNWLRQRDRLGGGGGGQSHQGARCGP